VKAFVVTAVLVSAAALSGCGTRMSDAAIAAADGSAVRTVTAPTDPTAIEPVAAATTARAPAALTHPAGPPPPVTGRRGGQPAAPVAPRTTQSAPASLPTGPDAPCPQGLSPVVLGQTSPTSGVIGASTFNMRAGISLWVHDVNARGGVQCHPVQMYQMDDGADPARVTSNLTELVKGKKAIAIVGAGVPTTFAAAKQFAEQNKVPFVGGDMIEAPWFSSPWFFPQGGGPIASYAGALREAALHANTTKVGLVYCVEAAICGQINATFDAMARASNLQVVLRKVSSIISPDYTAECQALRSAGAGAVFVALEGSGNTRFARSCLALGYRPAVATSALAVTYQAALDPNIRKLSVFLGAGNAPFVAADNLGARLFRAAYDRFAPGSPIDQNTIGQYTSGRLFEQAVAHVYARARSGPITRDLLLQGLWQIKHETLDGLAPPITFHAMAPPSPSDCYALLNLTPVGYTAPKGSSFRCLTGLPKGF
jgi:branched-chain amino acid transport system substrate-binding protein